MLEEILPVLRQFWQVWLVLLFVGIVVWTLWPGRRREMDEHARIPLRDEETGHGNQG